MGKLTAPRATVASIENMRKYHADDVIAYSPRTGEEYSADPSDYWNAPDGWVMKDSKRRPMILVRRVSYLEDVGK